MLGQGEEYNRKGSVGQSDEYTWIGWWDLVGWWFMAYSLNGEW